MSTVQDVNEQWLLARKPPGGLPVIDDFRWHEAEPAEPDAGQVLTRTIYLSMDPYQWVRRRSGTEQPGSICHGRTVAQVVASRTDDYAEGDYLFNTNGWQRFGLSGQGVDHFGYMYPRKLDPSQAPLSTAIGVLGMLGLTAYAGLVVQCEPQAGETVLVSAASGGVGQVAGQLAKIRGARVVGIAGAAVKCEFVVNELGFDACVSHLSSHFADELRDACPEGCDVYFENVGGAVFEAVQPLLNRNARITLCGLISQYDQAGDPREIWRAEGASVFTRQNVAVHDLFVGNFVKDYQAQFLTEAADYVAQGLLKYREDRWAGLERAPEAFSAMLTGGNFGKTIVEVAEE